MTTKTTNLTFEELWPLVRDGQCFDYMTLNGAACFKYIEGVLHLWQSPQWELHKGINTKELFKLVDDPSKPKDSLELFCARCKKVTTHRCQSMGRFPWCDECGNDRITTCTSPFPLQCDIQGGAIISTKSIEQILSLVREQLPQWLEELKK